MSRDLEELKIALDMEAYFQDEGISFQHGRGHSGPQLNVRRCPVCGDSNSKVSIGAESGLGNCFKCDARFNKFTFIMAHLGLDRDSKKDWRECFEVIERFVKGQGWRAKKVLTAAVENEKATLPISFPLPTPEGNNLIYLERRGVTGDIARYFHLRFSEHGRWAFTAEDGTRRFQDFSNRVIVPIYDLDGEFVSFQGRDVTGDADKKYLFPVGLAGTGHFLFNGQNSIHAKRIAIGEGVFDVIAMKLAFDENTDLRGVCPVGSFGKNLSFGSPDGDDQLDRLRRLKRSGLQQVTIMYDGEVKALESAMNAAKMISAIGIETRIALLPKGKDPNEVRGDIVCRAFCDAQRYTPKLDIQYRMRNPYR